MQGKVFWYFMPVLTATSDLDILFSGSLVQCLHCPSQASAKHCMEFKVLKAVVSKNKSSALLSTAICTAEKL